MNLGTLTTQAALLAGDPSLTRYANLYTDAANRAQEQFALDSKALFKDSSIVMVAGTSSYSLPTDFMYEKKVVLNGLILQPISRARLEQFSTTDWTLDTGTPTYFMIDPEEARKQITLYPQPQGGDAGTTLVLTYFPFPAALVNSTDTPLNASLLMTQFHLGIACYMAWLLMGYDTPTPEIQAKRSDLMKVYVDTVGKAVETFSNTASAPWRMYGGRYWRRDV